MPQIPYRATNFAGAFAHLNGNGQIAATWAQLVWAAVTVGKAAGDEYAFGVYSALERLHRASMMRAYLLEGTSGLLHQTMPYVASDPSEKTSISFYIGMTLAKLFAEVVFGVPRMLHFAVYGHNYQIAAGQGASRPDLIGLSANGNWFVFEAKGRSNGFDNEAMVTAKAQAEQINLINNVAPVCRIASQSFFSTNGLLFHMDDPERSSSSRSRSLDISSNDFNNAYYDPIRAIVESRGRIAELAVARRRFRGAQIKEMDCWIALRGQNDSLAEGSDPGPQFSSQYLGKDGVLVRLGPSWSEENMRLQPHLRLV